MLFLITEWPNLSGNLKFINPKIIVLKILSELRGYDYFKTH